MKKTFHWTLVTLVAGLLALGGRPAPANAAATDQFICSGGPHDGQACPGGDDDCFVSCPSNFGACVLVQGVCDGGDFDSFPCDCPGGTCNAGTAKCVGGAYDGEACTATDGGGTCGSGISCAGSYKTCASGTDKGFGCLRDNQCTNASCVSTGKFCESGDFQDFTCVDDIDCKNGAVTGPCVTPAFDCSTPTAATATPTRTTQPVFSRTPTPTSRTVVPTFTRAPTSLTRTPTHIGPTSTPTRTTTTQRLATATATTTPDGMGPVTAVVSQTAPINDTILVVDDASRFPATGTLTINDSAVQLLYTKNSDNRTLVLAKGLTEAVPAGSIVTVRAPFTPTPYVIHQTIYSQSSSCALQPTASSNGATAAGLVFGAIVLGLRRRRS